MREIKFRGKRADNGEWVYGDIVRLSHRGYVICESLEGGNNFVDLDSRTVGQFVGITDCNGIEIYEGDIVHYYQEYLEVPDNGKLEEAKKAVANWVGEIIFWSGAFAMHFTNEQNQESYMIIGLQENAQIKVVGNIHQPVAQCCEYMCTARASGLCKGEDYGRCLNKGQLNYNVTKKLIELINKKQQL